MINSCTIGSALVIWCVCPSCGIGNPDPQLPPVRGSVYIELLHSWLFGGVGSDNRIPLSRHSPRLGIIRRKVRKERNHRGILAAD